MGGALFRATVLLVCLTALFQTSCLESRADQVASSRDRLAKAVILTHKCGTCHTLIARGLRLDGTIGPDLSREGTRNRSQAWLHRQLQDPRSIPDGEVTLGFEGKQKLMPPLDVSETELQAVVDFLASLR